MPGAKLIPIEREPVIMLWTPLLVDRLSIFLDAEDQSDFKKLCRKIGGRLDKKHEVIFNELKTLHIKHFHPNDPAVKLNDGDPVIREKELRFLDTFRKIMKRSNFKLLRKEEWELARRSRYLLKFKIGYKKSKLDSDLLRDFFRPDEDDLFDHQFLVYHRGIGIDKTPGYFFFSKMGELRKCIWRFILSCCGWKHDSGPTYESNLEVADAKVDVVERVHIEDVKIRNFFQKVQLQEPTFNQVIVLYRLKKQDYKYGIHIKHFKEIPMADIEIVLPEKTTPRFSIMEWLKLVLAAATAGIALWEALRRRRQTSSLKFVFIIVGVLFSYCFKVYYTFYANVLEYEKLVSKETYERQQDTGAATLFYLYDNVLQQEVNETVVAYFGLLQGGRATKEELCSRCEDILKNLFHVSCNFEVGDAIKKLLELDIAESKNGYYECYPIQQAIQRMRKT